MAHDEILISPVLRFGIFELDTESEELRRSGRPVRLRAQAARVLALIAGRRGDLVTRDEIRRHIWGESFVDADAGLNVCIREVRSALGDRAASPAFVETVPRKGYRFVAPVEMPSAAAVPESAELVAGPRRGRLIPAVLVFGAFSLAALAVANFGGRTDPSPSVAERRAVDPAAYEVYLEARYLLEQEDWETKARSVGLFRRAIETQDDYADAYVGLGQSFLALNAPPHERMPGARQAFERALELDPGLAEAHFGMGRVHLNYDWDFVAARDAFEEARVLGLDTSEFHEVYAIYLILLDRRDEARVHLDRALELDPVSARLQGDIGWIYELWGDHEKSAEQCQRALSLEPDHVSSFSCLVASYSGSGRTAEAHAAARRYMEILGAPAEVVARLDTDGLEAYHRFRLDRLRSRRSERYVRACALGILHAKAGDADESFVYFDAAIGERASFMLFFEIEPGLAYLRDDPRYAALAAKIRAEIRGL